LKEKGEITLFNEAKEYLQKTLIVIGDEHANAALSFYNLGNVYQQLGQYNEEKNALVKETKEKVEFMDGTAVFNFCTLLLSLYFIYCNLYFISLIICLFLWLG